MALHDRWVQERKHEHYYKMAKKLNYRSRASFKLMQIDDRFGVFRRAIPLWTSEHRPADGSRWRRGVSGIKERWSVWTSAT